MKKTLRKMSSAVLMVCVAGTCAFAQRAASDQPTQTRRLVIDETRKIDASTATNQNVNKADIYRVSNEPLTQQQIAERDAKATQKNASTSKVTEVNQNQIPANTNKAGQTLYGTPKGTTVVPAARVNNTTKALPANYQAPSEVITKSEEK